MPGLFSDVLVYGIIAFVVLIIVVGSMGYIYSSYIYPSSKMLEFEKLPSGVRQQVDANWNNLIANITSCGKIVDFECVCGEFPNFPATFSSDFKIRVEEEKIILRYKNADIKEAQLRDGSILYFRGAQYAAAFDKISVDPTEYKGDIDFKGVSVDEKVYPFFISSKYPILTDKFYITAPKTVTFVYAFSLLNFLEQQKDVNSRPSCLQWRKSAIPKFNEFASCVNSNQLNKNCQFSVKDAGNYRVFIGAGNAYLKFGQDSVKNYNSTTEKSIDVMASVPIPCGNEFFAENGDSVKLSQKNAKICLQKV